jgi:teichuronic acid exporter
MSLVEQAKNGVLWGVSTKILNQGLSWIVTIWVIRLLTPEDFAIIALNELSIGLLLVIGRFGFQNAIIKAKNLSSSQINQSFTFLFLINVFMFLIVQSLASTLSSFFNNDQLEGLIRVSSILFLLLPFTTISYALIYRNMQYKKIAKLDVFINLSQICTNLILAILGYGFWALAIGVVVAQLLRAIGYSYLIKFKPKFNFNRQEIKQLNSDSNYSFFTGLVWELTHRVDIFFINHLVGTLALGFYRISLSLSEKPVALVGQVIQQIGLSSFAKISDDNRLVGQYVVKASSIMAFFTYPVFFGIASIAPNLVPLALGSKWYEVIVPLQILCMVQLVNTLKDISSTALFSVNGGKRNLIHTLIALISVSIAWWVGLTYSFIFGCSLYAITYFIWYIIHIIDTSKFIDLTGFWKCQIIPCISSLVMFFMVGFLGDLLSHYSMVIVLISQSVLGVLVYASICFIFFRKRSSQIVDFFLKKQGK